MYLLLLSLRLARTIYSAMPLGRKYFKLFELKSMTPEKNLKLKKKKPKKKRREIVERL